MEVRRHSLFVSLLCLRLLAWARICLVWRLYADKSMPSTHMEALGHIRARRDGDSTRTADSAR